MKTERNDCHGQIREILQLGHSGLRCICRPVESFSEQRFHQVIADLKATLAETAGVGLAAPQIGEALQIIIIASKPTVRYPQAPMMEPVVMINPEMDVLQDRQVKDWEGCLSIPGIRALVPRYPYIRVNYLDEQGLNHSLELTDFPARVFQHEYDHLLGMVYLDRVENNRDIVAESVYQEILSGKTIFG